MIIDITVHLVERLFYL